MGDILDRAEELQRLALPELEDVSELDEVANHGLLAVKLSPDGRAVRDRRLRAPDECADQHRPQGLAAQQLGTARLGSIDAPMLIAPQVEHGELGERLKQGLIAATTMVRRIGRPEEVAAATAFLAGDDAPWHRPNPHRLRRGLSA